MLTVKISEEMAVEMLMDRLHQWTDDVVSCDLFRQMYESYVYSGCFYECEFDVMDIVDNDWVNYCSVLTEEDPEYEEIKKIYDEQGLGDCSCESDVYSYIEAEYNNCFLVRC